MGTSPASLKPSAHLVYLLGRKVCGASRDVPECSTRSLVKKGQKGWEASKKRKAQGASHQLLRVGIWDVLAHASLSCPGPLEGQEANQMKIILRKTRVPVWPELAWKQSLVGRREELRSSYRRRGGDCAPVARLRSDPHPPASAAGKGQHSLPLSALGS